MESTKVEFNKEQRKDLLMIDPRLIIADESFNVRGDYGDIEELKNSIVENGVRVALQGYRKGDYYVLTDGFRRNKAIQLALSEGLEIARVPFMLEAKSTTTTDRLLSMFILNDGKRLTGIEEGELFKRLEALGFTRKEIAKKTGRFESHISNMITLASQDKEVKEAVLSGEIKATTVTKLIQQNKGDVEKVAEVVKEAVTAAKETGEKATAAKLVKNEKPIKTFNNLKDIAIELNELGIENAKTEVLEFLLYNFNKPMDEIVAFFKS